MRLWSIHPKYLDRAGLLAVWREGLLAKKVLEGKTKGYKNHPQLIRFRTSSDPLTNINRYLSVIYYEAVARGYEFSAKKIRLAEKISPKIKVTDKQLAYEFRHLLKKLATRDPNRYWKLKNPKKGTDIVV
ncbi:MAG: pyrimidine dimer DNA glycosylase/endonuclease V, partial [Patescibacteria group bacterium]